MRWCTPSAAAAAASAAAAANAAAVASAAAAAATAQFIVSKQSNYCSVRLRVAGSTCKGHVDAEGYEQYKC